ncbi:MAG TPA: ABC transporter substrate-binding protein [Stellaceae bacterium]|nr:ABC transporter substrate-binding protein [Stellaceae bacterium]
MKAFRILAATAVFFGACQMASAADLPTVRLGWVVAPGSTAALLMMKPDASVHRGVTYKFEPMHFVSTAVELTPFASNQVDIIDMSYAAIGSAIENAHLSDLRIIADEIQNGVDGHDNGSGFLVLKDGSIKDFPDLKGKAVAVLTLGSAVDMQARVMLRRHGLEDKRDYNLIEAQFANMKSLLIEGKAAMVAIAPPFAFDPELQSASRMFFTETDAMGPTQLLALAARKSYIDQNRAVLVDFLEDAVRTVRWFTDPQNHDAAIQLASAMTKQPPAQLQRLFTKADNYRSPSGEPNLDALQHSLDLQHDMGMQKTKIDIRNYADVSLVHEAASRIK